MEGSRGGRQQGANLLGAEPPARCAAPRRAAQVTAISRAIRRARVGLKNPNRPIASFIFSGGWRPRQRCGNAGALSGAISPRSAGYGAAGGLESVRAERKQAPVWRPVAPSVVLPLIRRSASPCCRPHGCGQVRAGQDAGELLLRQRGGHGAQHSTPGARPFPAWPGQQLLARRPRAGKEGEGSARAPLLERLPRMLTRLLARPPASCAPPLGRCAWTCLSSWSGTRCPSSSGLRPATWATTRAAS